MTPKATSKNEKHVKDAKGTTKELKKVKKAAKKAGAAAGGVPPLAAPRRARKASVAERTLDNGLRVLAVRRPGTPLAEVRLRIPFAASAASHTARSSVLSETMLAGTADKSTVDLAVALQSIGGGLHASTDPDRLLLGGNSLASTLPELLGVLGEVVTGATYPGSDVTRERDRLADQLQMAWSQPGVVAHDALTHRLFGKHPYRADIPHPEQISAVTPAQVRALHRSRVVPAGAVLVIVGDVTPKRALDAAEAALSEWDPAGNASTVPPLPAIHRGPITLLDRPEAVQSNLRLGGPAERREDPDYPAMQMANMVFGGYFSSRLTENIREDKGYTYSPHCVIDHREAGSTLLIEADVATEVTAPALNEIRYELGRMATLPVTQSELDDARQYAIGSLALATSSQSGLAGMLTALLVSGLEAEWLAEHPLRLLDVSIDDVAAAAARYLNPVDLATVVVGDAGQIAGPLSTLDAVEALES